MNKRKLGEDKEQLAADYLEAAGYEIIERNFRCRMGEIDLIAKDRDTLVFTEVKYRVNHKAGLPEEAVDCKKQRTIGKVALYYLKTRIRRMDAPCRFDVIAIDGEEIRHHINAFSYEGAYFG
ncbi:MAG: YraN family protein [Lachnospiraceae bacterium]|nr:YraN family protein [Lachnospiraceae bacterium]